jgi:hypothetical protein
VNLTNTIDGAGLLGANSLTFSNAGTVDANQPGSLTLNTGANLAINTGVMQSSNTGGLVILNTAGTMPAAPSRRWLRARMSISAAARSRGAR